MPNTLEATIDIAATPDKVWAVVSDLGRMPEFSPTTLKMIPLGTPRAGTWTVNFNKVGRKYYPTTSRIVRYEPDQAFAFRMNENGTVWSYTLEPTAAGTRVTERRDVPNGVRKPVRLMIDALLGGEQRFEADLVAGMNETLGKIKAAVER
ncbi:MULTISPECIES: SRPBCC family protein [Nocardia]|uniref:SRPBCC family protein n=2 Tax=Nocardia TaxID=1817 RepID=A0A2T2YS68_9NOCA|nr:MULTISPECIES: SRPBCC family protein [Nocardia]MBF6451699.1 SRPBCC family protein [Nocardia elegans]PSR58347.1 SRPBCC family protein [Nocardia nova]